MTLSAQDFNKAQVSDLFIFIYQTILTKIEVSKKSFSSRIQNFQLIADFMLTKFESWRIVDNERSLTLFCYLDILLCKSNRKV